MGRSDVNEFPIRTDRGAPKGDRPGEFGDAQAMSDAIAKSGRLDVYGITFATGSHHTRHRTRS